MKRYGRTIIDAIFKKRAKRLEICAELESKSQADSDRSDIGVFETGLSAEQYGNYEQSTGVAAQEAESRRLVSVAKAHGLYVPKEKWAVFGERKKLPSGESVVYLDAEEQVITKIRNPFAKAAIKHLHAQDVIYEHLIHNILFPSTRYEFRGIGEDVDGVRIILGQQYLTDKYMTPNQKAIDNYLMHGLGLELEN